ncbi:amidohydrolase family protein [Kineococcus arenarius]|uniref:amidohydrolase family protein n=1 Tax=unclassified Kineococcus TaxID=2621656 RepID=UPI003D7D74C4
MSVPSSCTPAANSEEFAARVADDGGGGAAAGLVHDLLVRPDQLPAATALARCGDVSCKLSGLFTLLPPGGGDELLEPVVDHLLQVFGPHRLLFGTDWPVSTLAAEHGEVVRRTAALLRGLSPGERAAVLGGTAGAVYDLR